MSPRRITPTSPRPRVAGGAILLALLAGCGPGLPPAAEPLQARDALTSALDAWVRGESVRDQPQADSPVRIFDRQWEEGYTLNHFELQGPGHRLGLGIQQTVLLELRSPEGQPERKTVNYIIQAGSPPVITRQDIDD